MPEGRTPKVGIQDVRELMPKGRAEYAAARDYVTRGHKDYSVYKVSPAIDLLASVVRNHTTMQPPLPEEVVATISEFLPEYGSYIHGEGRGYISDERRRLENVADGFISVVFEYGYGNVLTTPPVQD